MELPSIKIVSMTVTEGGYYLSNGHFDSQHPEIQHDIENPATPTTVFGMIVKALDRRRKAGVAPFAVLSCDNIPHNGQVVRSVVVGMANYIDRDLAKWIDETVAFPNSMVDRITPGTTADHSEYIKTEYGYEDASAIFCEPFRQWVRVYIYIYAIVRSNYKLVSVCFCVSSGLVFHITCKLTYVPHRTLFSRRFSKINFRPVVLVLRISRVSDSSRTWPHTS